MRMKDEIFYNTYGYGKNPLNEMAAAELAKVIDLIKAGNVDQAAEKYIELGGNSSSSGVGKTVNTFLKKNPDVDPTHFESFKSSVTKVAATKGIKSARPDTYQTGTTGVTRKGEEIVVKGQDQARRKQNVLKVIDKQKAEIDAERAMLDAGTDDSGLRQMAKEFVNDMQYAELPGARKTIAVLDNFSKTGENKDKAIDLMHTIVDEGEEVMKVLKQRVAAGNMVKPSEAKMLGQVEKYRTIDVAKAQKSLDADKAKQLEAK